MHQIVRGVYYESSYQGVTLGAILLPHLTLLIDAPLRAEDARAWRSMLLNAGSSPNRFLVNLDAHPDRTLGARALDCPVIAHQKTAQVFRNRPSVFKGQNTESGSEWEASNDVVGTRWATPDITFSDQLVFHWDDHELILTQQPGPTQGSIWAVVPYAKVIFVGDTILQDQPPFLASADLPAWIESLNKLQTSYKDYLVISGRGGAVDQEAVQDQKHLMEDILKGMERLAKRGATSEMTEVLVDGLLTSVTLPLEKREQYMQRLRHGLYQYYNRRYRPIESTLQDPE